MNQNTPAKEIADRLGISTRHARRLRANGDARLLETDHRYIQQCRRERISSECYDASFRLGQLGAKLKQSLEIDPLTDPAHTTRLGELMDRLKALDAEFSELAEALESK